MRKVFDKICAGVSGIFRSRVKNMIVGRIPITCKYSTLYLPSENNTSEPQIRPIKVEKAWKTCWN